MMIEILNLLKYFLNFKFSKNQGKYFSFEKCKNNKRIKKPEVKLVIKFLEKVTHPWFILIFKKWREVLESKKLMFMKLLFSSKKLNFNPKKLLFPSDKKYIKGDPEINKLWKVLLTNVKFESIDVKKLLFIVEISAFNVSKNEF